jgi:hypothetical protein
MAIVMQNAVRKNITAYENMYPLPSEQIRSGNLQGLRYVVEVPGAPRKDSDLAVVRERLLWYLPGAGRQDFSFTSRGKPQRI